MGFAEIVIQGNLVRDPETRTTVEGNDVTSFTVAVNLYRNGNETTEYIRVSAWGKRSEFASKYLKKGSGVIVSGEPGVYAWNAREDGHARAAIEIRADKISFTGSKVKEETPAPETGPTEMMPADDDDDLPF